MKKVTTETITKEYQHHDQDSGSSDVQVALLTRRIEELTEHLKEHRNDHSSRHGLIKMVSRRRKLLDYIRSRDEKRYQELIKRLKLRR